MKRWAAAAPRPLPSVSTGECETHEYEKLPSPNYQQYVAQTLIKPTMRSIVWLT